MTVVLSNGAECRFDVLYPALGCHARSQLAEMLGIDVRPDGGLPTDQGQRTMVEGVYAAGDLVEGLDQISVAIGHGAIAVTKAHNRLRELDGDTLQD
jgi:thioredoxin reductase (NADPH)